MPRKARIDKAAVVEAAVQLVNAEGPAALSLSRLADELGVQTPSLYNHINGLPGLQRELAVLNARLLADRLGKAAIGKAGMDALVAMAQAYRGYIKEFPGLYMSTLRSSGTQEEVDKALEQEEKHTLEVGLAVVGSFGLKGKDAVHALRGFRSVVHGFATLEIAGGFGIPLDCDESFRRLVAMLGHTLTMPKTER